MAFPLEIGVQHGQIVAPALYLWPCEKRWDELDGPEEVDANGRHWCLEESLQEILRTAACLTHGLLYCTCWAPNSQITRGVQIVHRATYTQTCFNSRCQEQVRSLEPWCNNNNLQMVDFPCPCLFTKMVQYVEAKQKRGLLAATWSDRPCWITKDHEVWVQSLMPFFAQKTRSKTLWKPSLPSAFLPSATQVAWLKRLRGTKNMGQQDHGSTSPYLIQIHSIYF